MSGAIPSFPQYAFMARCSVKAEEVKLHTYLIPVRNGAARVA
jgi:hypothetical protein